MGQDQLLVLGLKELVRDLRAWERTAPRLVSQAHKRIADRVAGKAKATASGQGSVAAKAAPSIRGSGRMTSAAVLLGGAAYPFALGAEFGALQYPQFLPWKGNSEEAGYFLYPTIRAMEDEIREEYLDEVYGALERRAFPV